MPGNAGLPGEPVSSLFFCLFYYSCMDLTMVLNFHGLVTLRIRCMLSVESTYRPQFEIISSFLGT